MINEMNLNEIYFNVRSRVQFNVWDHLGNRIANQVRSQVKFQVHSKVYNNIRFKVSNVLYHIANQIKETLQ